MDAARFIEEDHAGKSSGTGYNSSRIGEPSGICDIFLIGLSYLLIVCTFPLSIFMCFKVVQEYERAVIFRLGRLSKGGARGPGLFFILPCTDNYCKVDLRTVSFNVPPQEVLSKDSVTVSVDAVVYYRISNATIAISNVANYDSSTQLLAATTLRTVLGTKSLSEILSEREQISHTMQMSDNKRKTLETHDKSCKKIKEETIEMNGVMLDDHIPDGMYCLGDSVFVYPSTFKGRTLVHIRRYKKYVNKFYPTQEGVTLQPWWIQYVMHRTEVPKTKKDLQVNNFFLPADQFQMVSLDFQNFTFTQNKYSLSGQCFSKSITITGDQWKRMMDQYNEISTAVADEFYESMDFLTAYKNVHDLPLDTVLPSSLDVSLGQHYLTDTLRKSFCTYMKDSGDLQDPETRAEELFGNRAETFNNIALCQNVQELVHNFYDSLLEEQNFLAMRPHSYLTQDFLKNVCLKDIIQKARKYFCPDETFEFFEDFM